MGLKRAIGAVPVIGPPLRAAYGATKLRLRPTAEMVAKRNTRRGYDKFFGSDEYLRQYLDEERLRFFREVADVCAALRPDSVLDVGCGTGHLLAEIAERGAATRLVGFDHSKQAIRRARRLVPEAELIVADLFKLSLAEEFDLITCTEVLEHLRRPDHAMRVLVGCCRPGGHVVITVPDGAVDTWEGHVNFWDEHQLQGFLRPYGLQQVRRATGDLLAVCRPH
jgi:2-polyprenyl-3-methyl-5-hydroxy-6-metoxy-1,4-benzoquinol methylase